MIVVKGIRAAYPFQALNPSVPLPWQRASDCVVARTGRGEVYYVSHHLLSCYSLTPHSSLLLLHHSFNHFLSSLSFHLHSRPQSCWYSVKVILILAAACWLKPSRYTALVTTSSPFTPPIVSPLASAYTTRTAHTFDWLDIVHPASSH